jgi:hypothetical protein
MQLHGATSGEPDVEREAERLTCPCKETAPYQRPSGKIICANCQMRCWPVEERKARA